MGQRHSCFAVYPGSFIVRASMAQDASHSRCITPQFLRRSVASGFEKTGNSTHGAT